MALGSFSEIPMLDASACEKLVPALLEILFWMAFCKSYMPGGVSGFRLYLESG